MFHLSDKFLNNYLPHTIELGRSFVSLKHQSSGGRSGGAIRTLYALDNLWDGLGALTVKYPQIKYLFGKVTMYPDYDPECRDMLLGFLHKYFPDHENLVRPIDSLATNALDQRIQTMFSGDNFKDDYKILNGQIRNRGVNIPPLINAYMSLSPTMKIFGTAINHEFGEVEETGIFITISDIFEEKKRRHINTYVKNELQDADKQ